MKPSIRSLAALALLLAAGQLQQAHALTYLVGAGATPGTCDFNDLQQAVDAAAANPGVDFIRVASDRSYSMQALQIGQQDLTITGGYASCTAALPADAAPTGSTLLDGAGGSAASVVSISGSGVRVLSNLQIRNGDDVQANGSGCGGGIHFAGRGDLRLRNIDIAQNSANNGGGICFGGVGGLALLHIEGDTVVNSNVATSGNGGGISIAGSARMYMLHDRALVALNEAPHGEGGGIYLQSPARADIGSPGFGNLGVLYSNEARRGGGLAIVAPETFSDGSHCARLFTTDANRPVRLHHNRASEAGGGLYMRTNWELGERSIAFIRAYDFRIDANTAPNGPAVHLSGDGTLGATHGARVFLNRAIPYPAGDFCNDSLAALGRVPCSNPALCNRIDNNLAQDLHGNPTNGNVIELRDGSHINGSTVTLAENSGMRLLSWSSSDRGEIELQGCAMTGNVVSAELVRGFNFGVLALQDCTIGGNQIGGSHVLRLDEGDAWLALVRVLIDQPQKLTLAHPEPGSNTQSGNWVLATDISTLPADPTVRAGSARFVDPEHGDFRLRIGSEAVDYAPVDPLPERDLDLRDRDVDLADASANTQIRDLGGFERQLDDPWLLNGDFVADLRLWNNTSPAHTSWNGEHSAPGSVGGSLQLRVPFEQIGATGRRTAATQCFNVPSAGQYQIVGQALVAGNSTTADYPFLRWRVRYDDANCSGVEDDFGEVAFGRSQSTWRTTLEPALVEIDPLRWTRSSTIEVLLDAAQNPASPLATELFARFDEIEILRTPTAPEIFNSGFEDLLPAAPR